MFKINIVEKSNDTQQGKEGKKLTAIVGWSFGMSLENKSLNNRWYYGNRFQLHVCSENIIVHNFMAPYFLTKCDNIKGLFN